MIHGAQNGRAPKPEPEPNIYIDIFMDTSMDISMDIFVLRNKSPRSWQPELVAMELAASTRPR